MANKRHDSVISLTAVQSGEKVFVCSVDAIYGSVSSDIAFLRFRRPSWWGDGPGQIIPRCARLNLNPAAVGDTVRVFGFPNSELHEGVLTIFPAECECRVQKVDVMTDKPSWYKPLSHVELEGEIEHGMSGGPCFDKDWNVMGVNSLGWDGLPSAKVALLWRAMRVEIDCSKPGYFPQSSSSGAVLRQRSGIGEYT
jgi:Trypsin-like peptidase domain